MDVVDRTSVCRQDVDGKVLAYDASVSQQSVGILLLMSDVLG